MDDDTLISLLSTATAETVDDRRSIAAAAVGSHLIMVLFLFLWIILFSLLIDLMVVVIGA